MWTTGVNISVVYAAAHDLTEAQNEKFYQKKIESLHQALQGDAVIAHPYDVFRLLDQYASFPNGKRPKINSKRIHLQLSTADQVARIDRYRTDNATKLYPEGVSAELRFHNHTLQQFRMKFTQALFYGSYLVFTEVGGYFAASKIQNLLFIDLNYFKDDLGLRSVPVFRLPVRVNGAGRRLSVDEVGIRLGDVFIPQDFLDQYCKLSHMTYNVAANLADPTFYARYHDDINEMLDLFLEGSKKSYEQLESMAGNSALLPQAQADFADEWVSRIQAGQDLRKTLNQESGFESFQTVKHYNALLMTDEKLLAAKSAHSVQRKLVARIGRVLGYLMLPKPASSDTIVGSMAMVAEGLREKNHEVAVEGGLRFFNHPYIKRGALPVAMAVFSSTHPDLAQAYALRGLDLARQAVEGAWGTAVDVAMLTTHSARELTYAIVNPQVIYDAYLSNGKSLLTIKGMSAMFSWLAVRVGLIHVSVNAVSLFADMKRLVHESYANEYRDFHPLKKVTMMPEVVIDAFIARQKAVKDAYLVNQAKHLASKAAGVDSEWKSTPELDALVDEYMAKVAGENGPDRSFAAAQKSAVGSRLGSLFHSAGNAKVVLLAKALTQFISGIDSLTKSVTAMTKIWNYVIFPVRTFLWNPLTMLPHYLTYPEFFFAALRKENSVVVPTEWDGGTRNILQTVQNLFLDQDQRAKIDAFETMMIDAEFQIQEQVKQHAMRASIQHLKNEQDFAALIKNGGITSFQDSALKQMPRRARVFYRHYFDQLYQKSMDAFIAALEGLHGHEEVRQQSITERRLNLINEKIDVSLGAAHAKQLVDLTQQEYATEIEAHANRASKMTIDPDIFFSKFSTNKFITDQKYQLLARLDPKKSKSFKRVILTHEALKDQSLMQRITLKQAGKFLVDIPMELAIMMVIFAGATTAELIPIQAEEMSATSWHHLSTALFKGWAVGTLVSVLANSWVDVQTLYRQKNSFGAVPEGADQKLTFIQWMYKKGWQSKENSLMECWKDSNDVIIGNIKSALSLTAILSVATFGRFDLDFYIVGYALSVGLPLSAISFKVENSFENASDYYFKEFPKEIRLSPRVLNYVNQKKGRARLVFNFWYRLLWDNPVGYFMQSMEMVTVPSIGPRSLVRTMFGGETPTIWAQKGLNLVKAGLSGVPGAADAVDACSHLLTNNYPAWGPKGKPQ